ncbi:MAG: hypothetical protein RLZZ352_2782 [Pseudomonadota bacterium]
MKNVFSSRAAWMAGVSALVLLSACGGGGSGTGTEKLAPQNASVWVGESSVKQITVKRVDGAAVSVNTVVQVSEWTCAATGELPQAAGEVAIEAVTGAANSVTFDSMRLPATKLLVRVMNGNSTYYPYEASVFSAKLYDMATAGDASGNLVISYDVAPDSEEKLAAQFDKCP